MIRYLTLSIVMVLLASGSMIGQAQEKVVLTLSVPQWNQAAFNREYLQPFRDTHPNIDVVVVADVEGLAYPTSPAYGTLEEHLEAVQAYASTADVLQVSTWSLSQESTRARLWLDLNPLVTADPALAEENFYPAAWRAFRWDQGMWGMPVVIEPQILTYNPAAFDDAGLTYPAANWAIEQYIEAAVALTERNNSGDIIRPGCWCDITLMLYGLLGHGLVDASGAPQFDDPLLASIIETWAAAREDIYPQGGYSSEGVPIMMMQPWILQPSAPDAGTMVIGDMPGGVYGAQVTGFGISAGTRHPEEAFELAKFLAQSPGNASGSFGAFPALRQAEIVATGNFSIPPVNSLPQEQQDFLKMAVENAVAGYDLRYFDYINYAINQAISEDLDVETALQQAEEKALANLNEAASWTAAQPLVVATPVPTPSFDSGEIVLKFGMNGFNLPNQTDWVRLAREFAENDPEVGVIEMTSPDIGYEIWQEENECFYLGYDAVSPEAVPEYLLLDPLLDADPNFDPNDFVPGALEALQSGGQTYGYPFTVQVAAIRYLPEQFDDAGIPHPTMTWTISEFVDALNQLDQVEDADYQVPFIPRQPGHIDWLMLIAAFGGLPMDYRTEPPTINLTDPANVDAIRQALDLARSGLISYPEMGTFRFGGSFQMGALNTIDLGGYQFVDAQTPDYGYVNFPQGTAYKTMMLGNVGGGYISQDATHPDACYRWLRYIVAHPELLAYTMPASLSAINGPVTAATQGEAAVALYQNYVELASDPNTINFPAQFGSSYKMYFAQLFMARAFDDYVLEDADLEQVLADAQTKTEEFFVCFDAIPPTPPGATEAEYIAYSEAVENCLAVVDPEAAAERAEAMGGVQ